MNEIKYLPAGDSALIVSFGEDIDENINKKVLAVWKRIEEEGIKGIIEVIPTYRDLCIYFNPLQLSLKELKEKLNTYVNTEYHENKSKKVIEVPVAYGGEYGPDLEYVAKYHDLTPEQVVEIHSSRDYLVYMIGFSPGFPYLGGLSEKLFTPRRETPHPKIPAGSVGIGGKQTAILTITSPSGWWFIGRTPLKFYDITKPNPSLLEPGDYIRFRPINADEYELYAEKG